MNEISECLKKEIGIIRDELEKGEYRYYGLRKDSHYEEGQVSRIWDGETGYPTQDYLDGLSVIYITLDTIENGLILINNYFIDKSNEECHIYLLGSDNGQDGEDVGEAILFEHVKLAQIK